LKAHLACFKRVDSSLLIQMEVKKCLCDEPHFLNWALKPGSLIFSCTCGSLRIFTNGQTFKTSRHFFFSVYITPKLRG